MGAEINIAGIAARVLEENASWQSTLENTANMKDTVEEFIGNTELSGKAYQNVKDYYSAIHLPFLTGLLHFAHHKQSENRQYQSYANSFFPGAAHISEDKLTQQRDRLRQIRRSLEEMPLLSQTYQRALYQTEQIINKQLDKIQDYLAQTNQLYTASASYLSQLELGSKYMEAVTFDSKTNTFVLPRHLDTGWVENIFLLRNQELKRLAYERYGDYLADNPADLDKVILIIEFERGLKPEEVQKVNTFLSPLEQYDCIQIKAIVYSAPPMFRDLWLHYADRYTISVIGENEATVAHFDHFNHSIHIKIESDRTESQGAYHAFFHECGHAIDFYSPLSPGRGYTSLSYRDDNGLSLFDHSYNDARRTFETYLNALQETLDQNPQPYNNTDLVAPIPVEDILHKLLHTHEAPRLADFYHRDLERDFKSLFRDQKNAIASDTYGALTDQRIAGSFRHERDYWRHPDGSIKTEPQIETFAEWYSHKIRQDPDTDACMNEFLPDTNRGLENMIAEMRQKI